MSEQPADSILTGRDAVIHALATQGHIYAVADMALDEGWVRMRTEDGRQYVVAPDGTATPAGHVPLSPETLSWFNGEAPQ